MVIVKTLKKSLVILPMALLVACGGGEKKDEPQTLVVADSSKTEALNEDERTMSYILPSPMQIASLFHKAKLKYNEKLLNPISNASSYGTETRRTLNIGIYGADMAYSIINNQGDKALASIKAMKDLSDKIGMGTIYDNDDILNRFKTNINNVDSLTDIISTIQLDSEMYLEENDKKFVALEIFTGGWIEALYLAGKSVEKDYSEKISRSIAEQHVALTNLIKLLSSQEPSKNEEFQSVLNGLKEINAIFESTAGYAKAKAELSAEDEDIPFVFDLSKEEVSKLASKCEEVRNKIVQ